jgi:hypothetical protein
MTPVAKSPPDERQSSEYQDANATRCQGGGLRRSPEKLNPTCHAALDGMLSHIDQNDGVWAGWTHWAAGPWWGDSRFSIEPEAGVDKPQMAVLAAHLA